MNFANQQNVNICMLCRIVVVSYVYDVTMHQTVEPYDEVHQRPQLRSC